MEPKDKKDDIMNAAEELFSELGFEGTSVRDIAAKADVNVAMINYYFGSKHQLLEALITRRSDITRNELEQTASDPDLHPLQKIEKVSEYYIRKFIDNSRIYRIFRTELALQQRSTLHEMIAERIRFNKDIIEHIIKEGQKKKIFRKDIDTTLLIYTIVSLLSNCNNDGYMKIYFGEGVLDDPEQKKEFVKRIRKHLKNLFNYFLLNES